MLNDVDKNEMFKFNSNYYVKDLLEVYKFDVDRQETNRLMYWAKIDDKYYYLKKAKNLNELIGEILANNLDLKTAHYSLANYNNEIYYMSLNFIEDNISYHRLNYYIYYKMYEDSLEHFKNNINYLELKEQILKMYAIDIYMKQTDRGMINILLEELNGSISLAPVFDYQASFMSDDFDVYKNAIYDIKINELDKVFSKYPELRDYLEIIININLIKELENKTNENKLIMSDNLYSYYSNLFENRNEEVCKKIRR